jgi:hypothetical protein
MAHQRRDAETETRMTPTDITDFERRGREAEAEGRVCAARVQCPECVSRDVCDACKSLTIAYWEELRGKSPTDAVYWRDDARQHQSRSDG